MKVEGEKSALVAHFSTTVSNLKLKTAVNAKPLYSICLIHQHNEGIRCTSYYCLGDAIWNFTVDSNKSTGLPACAYSLHTTAGTHIISKLRYGIEISWSRVHCYVSAFMKSFQFHYNYVDILIGLLRLRKCSKNTFRPELTGGVSIVRELHVYPQHAANVCTCI